MVLKKKKGWTENADAFLDKLMRSNEKLESGNLFQPTYQPSQFKKQLEEGRRSPKNTQINKYLTVQDIDGPVFSPEYEAIQKEKLHRAAMNHKEDFYKNRFPESEEIPKGTQDYKDNLFEKIFQANIDAQNRATVQAKNQQILTQQQYEQNAKMWNFQQAQLEKQTKVQRIARDLEMDEAKYRSLGTMAGSPDFITEDLLRLRRKRAQEEIDSIVK